MAASIGTRLTSSAGNELDNGFASAMTGYVAIKSVGSTPRNAMRDGNRSSIFDEVRKTLARAEAAIHAAETARDKATRTVQRACEIQQRGARRRSA